MRLIDLEYGFWIFWALILGALVAGAFRGSWQVENGKKNISWYGLRYRSDTVVWVDPILFPAAAAIYFGLGLYACIKMEIPLNYISIVIIDVFLFITVYFTLLFLLLPLLRKYYTARTCATLWLIPLFLLYQPYLSLPPKIILYFP